MPADDGRLGRGLILSLALGGVVTAIVCAAMIWVALHAGRRSDPAATLRAAQRAECDTLLAIIDHAFSDRHLSESETSQIERMTQDMKTRDGWIAGTPPSNPLQTCTRPTTRS